MVTRSQRAEQRRQDILEAALQVFSGKGYHASGIADIAVLLGIGHGTFYRYFQNKRAIFDALLASILQALAEVLHDEPPTRDSLGEYEAQLNRIASRLFALFAADARLGRILLFEAPGVDSDLQRQFQLAMGNFARMTEAYLQNGLNKGFLRPMDTGIAAKAINAVIIEGIRAICFSPEPEAQAERWASQSVGLMLHGIAPQPGA